MSPPNRLYGTLTERDQTITMKRVGGGRGARRTIERELRGKPVRDLGPDIDDNDDGDNNAAAADDYDVCS